jgi:uncharacterized circularly permuted ATP-grasp superfamily protein/uncharacterized alpha-E superfamily protein
MKTPALGSRPPFPHLGKGKKGGWDEYAGPALGFDEMKANAKELRPHWQTLVHSLQELGADEFVQRWQGAQDLIHENGVTYNVYGDPRGLDRPWQLDPIPFLISAREGEQLQEGLVQRARLLEAILADLYGPQNLLARGLLPPELVFANPGFLRPCHGIDLAGGRFLYLVAFDLGRARDGTWHVLGDRSQGPSGAGYALENRIVLARMLSEVFRCCRVQRLALFFRNLRDTLRKQSLHNRDNPRIVLLTPGPYNETYFEHAYLARYLGFTLAEGGDLTVRNQRLYLKLLDGLQPVDVLWRRLDDDFCDPLELRGDSSLGIPGLVQTVRAGNVVVANALGSSLAESAAFQPYLPSLCQHLLGETLQIPSAPAFWCGDPSSLQHVLANLSHMVIKPAFPHYRFDPIFPEKLSQEERHDLVERLRHRPQLFIGQEQLDLSSTPVLTNHGVEPRHAVVRFYLGAQDTCFSLMPGGLTRVTSSPESRIVSLQKGGGSKDTWFLTEGEVHEFSLLPMPGQPVELNRGGNDLPSRAADNLFWLGRYVHRAENLVRLLRSIVVRLTEKSGLTEVPELPTFLRLVTKITQTSPGFIGPCAEERLAAPEDELFDIIFQTDKVGSLAYNIQSLHRVAGSVRDRISMDMWRTLSHLALENHQNSQDRPTLGEVLQLLNVRVITLAGFGGIAMESMTRGLAWCFLDMGRRIEHALQIGSLLRGTLANVNPQEVPVLEGLLEIADSSMTYRRRYLTTLQVGPVLDLLLADESNPRSLVYQLLSLKEVLLKLPGTFGQATKFPQERLILQLLTLVQLADIDKLVTITAGNQRAFLDEFLESCDHLLQALSNAITQQYLSHLKKSRQLAGSADPNS